MALEMAARAPTQRPSKCVTVGGPGRPGMTPRAGLLTLDTNDDLSQPGNHDASPQNIEHDHVILDLLLVYPNCHNLPYVPEHV